MAVTAEAPRAGESEASTMLAHVDSDAKAQLALAKPYAPGQTMTLIPRTLDEACRFAQLIARSEMVPKDYRNKPENILTSIMFGADVGLSPMQALQSIANINGRPSLWGDGFLAVVMSLPQYKDHEECYVVDGKEVDYVTAADLAKPETMAVARFWRKGRAKPFVATFSVADAKKASLIGKSGPWSDYPQRMLKYRARGFAARDAFPDGLRGLHLAEEAQDIAGEVIESTIVPQPMRASETAAAANGAGAAAQPAAHVASPDLRGDAAPASTPGGEAAAGKPASTGNGTSPRSAAPASPLPEGLDRVSAFEKAESKQRPGKFWWKAVTERKRQLYTLVGSPFGPLIERAHRDVEMVKYVTEADGRIIDLAIIDGSTGEQKA